MKKQWIKKTILSCISCAKKILGFPLMFFGAEIFFTEPRALCPALHADLSLILSIQPIDFPPSSSSSYLLEPLAPGRDQWKGKKPLFSLQVTVSAWAPAQTRKTRVASTWTLPRPGTTCMSGSVASACWPGKRGTGGRWRKTAFDRHPLHPSCTTLSTSAASSGTRSKVCAPSLSSTDCFLECRSEGHPRCAGWQLQN